MIPRIGEAPRPNIQYTLRPGAYVILPRGQSILLTAQIGDTWDYQLPGGGIDAGESSRQALYREVLEETGWSISLPCKVGSFRRFVFMPEYDLWAEKLCMVYHARPARKIQDPIEPDHQTVWLAFDEALARLGNEGDRLMLERFLHS